MPKSKTRKRGGTKRRVSGASTQEKSQTAAAGALPATARGRRVGRGDTGSVSGLVMRAMVALGCWGFAVSFMFLNDPNRYLFAGMAVLLALMWSISFGIRLRRWQQRR
jgi:hypothetical protein